MSSGHVKHSLRVLAGELAGGTRTTAHPTGGSIIHDTAGEPTGTLEDSDGVLGSGHVPPATLAQKAADLRMGIRLLNGVGVTSLFDAGARARSATRARSTASSSRSPCMGRRSR